MGRPRTRINTHAITAHDHEHLTAAKGRRRTRNAHIVRFPLALELLPSQAERAHKPTPDSPHDHGRRGVGRERVVVQLRPNARDAEHIVGPRLRGNVDRLIVLRVEQEGRRVPLGLGGDDKA